MRIFNTIFAQLFEFFGLKLFSDDFSKFMRGLTDSCTSTAGPTFYLFIGLIVIVTAVLFFLLHYRLINSPTFNSVGSWWTMAIVLMAVNFSIAFLWPYQTLKRGKFCSDLTGLSGTYIADLFGFGLSVAVWTLIIYAIITTIPWPFKGHNMSRTTFWKP